MVNNDLVNLLKIKKLTISCAESCTGGSVSKAITDVSGCSAVFYGGIVSYANEVKMKVLGVSEETLSSFGAVSRETAIEMAEGVKRACGTDIGISTTGIAGPDGGTEEKPVGTVYVGFSFNGESDAFNLKLDKNMTRDEIRRETVLRLLKYAYDKISQSY